MLLGQRLAFCYHQLQLSCVSGADRSCPFTNVLLIQLCVGLLLAWGKHHRDGQAAESCHTETQHFGGRTRVVPLHLAAQVTGQPALPAHAAVGPSPRSAHYQLFISS